MNFTWQDLKINAVHRTDAAETQYNSVQIERSPHLYGLQYFHYRGCARHNCAVAIQRLTAFKVEQRSDSSRHSKNHSKKEAGIKKRRPSRQRRGNLRQEGEYNRAQHWTENRSAAAYQDRYEEQNRKVKGECIRRDVGLQSCEQSTRHRRRSASENKHSD